MNPPINYSISEIRALVIQLLPKSPTSKLYQVLSLQHMSLGRHAKSNHTTRTAQGVVEHQETELGEELLAPSGDSPTGLP